MTDLVIDLASRRNIAKALKGQRDCQVETTESDDALSARLNVIANAKNAIKLELSRIKNVSNAEKMIQVLEEFLAEAKGAM